MHPFKGGAVGCGDFIIYKLTEDNNGYVSIIFDMSVIELQAMQAYAIGKTDILNITRKTFDGPIHAALCNDVMGERPNELLSENAISGVFELRVSEIQRKNKERGEPYRVTVILKNIAFSTMTIDYLRLEDVTVGWLPG